jgi:hypothetical protein
MAKDLSRVISAFIGARLPNLSTSASSGWKLYAGKQVAGIEAGWFDLREAD